MYQRDPQVCSVPKRQSGMAQMQGRRRGGTRRVSMDAELFKSWCLCVQGKAMPYKVQQLAGQLRSALPLIPAAPTTSGATTTSAVAHAGEGEWP